MGYFVELTKSTGWWRSLPLYFLSTALIVTIVINKLIRTNDLKNTRFVTLYVKALSCAYLSVFVVLLVLMLVFKLDYALFVKVLGEISVRPGNDVVEYFTEYYFTSEIYLALLMLGGGGFLMLQLFSGLLKEGENTNIHIVQFVIVTIIFSVSVSSLFYPFNNGINQTYKIQQEYELSRLKKDFRSLFLVNGQIEVEKQIRENSLDGSLSTLDFNKKLSEYPEITRIQSNVVSQGGYFRTLGIPIYNKGNNFTDKSLSEYHFTLIDGNENQVEQFRKAKYDLKLNSKNLASPLFQYLSIKYIFTSLPVELPGFDLFIEGDMFSIYENSKTAPLWYLADSVVKTDKVVKPTDLEKVYPGYERIAVTKDVDMKSVIKDDRVLKLLEQKANSYKFFTDSQSPQFLVFGFAYNKNWSVFIDGVKQELVKTNYINMGVYVSQGEHEVTFRYRNELYENAKYLSLFSIFVIVSLIFFYRNEVLRPFKS